MKIKSYKKGEHTYTRYGKSLEVRHETAAKTEYHFEDDCRETYANDVSIRPGQGRLVLSFLNRLPPAGDAREKTRVFLDIQTAKKLSADLERMLKD